MAEWEDDGTYLGQEEDRAPTLALRRGAQRVRIRWASAWAEGEPARHEMCAALARLDGLLSRKFQSNRLNLASPVALGRHLLATAWSLDGLLMPPAPPEIRALLTEHSPQGRHECLTPADVAVIPALYEYDMRLAYLWCCKGLPYGAVERRWHDEADKLRVTWEAPETWRHLGLLPQRQQGWVYREQGEGWIDRREVDLAIRQGWSLVAEDGLAWESHGALDRWADGLQACLRQCKEEPLVYRMLRRVALNTLGSLHRSSVKRHRAAPRGQEDRLPASNPTLRMSDDGAVYYWVDETPISARGLLYVHPEWTTTIWARCRGRMAQAALQFPREALIAIRQDALFTTQLHPTWSDDGTVGRIRLKGEIPGPLKAPHSLEAFDALRREALP